MSNRRKFLKDIAAVGAGAFAAQALMGCSSSTSDKEKARIAAAVRSTSSPSNKPIIPV